MQTKFIIFPLYKIHCYLFKYLALLVLTTPVHIEFVKTNKIKVNIGSKNLQQSDTDVV